MASHRTQLSSAASIDVDAYSRRWKMRMVVRGGRLAGNCSATSERAFGSDGSVEATGTDFSYTSRGRHALIAAS